jgi:hypothetical protein
VHTLSFTMDQQVLHTPASLIFDRCCHRQRLIAKVGQRGPLAELHDRASFAVEDRHILGLADEQFKNREYGTVIRGHGLWDDLRV